MKTPHQISGSESMPRFLPALGLQTSTPAYNNTGVSPILTLDERRTGFSR